MSPIAKPRGGKIAPPSNLYTAILAVAFAVVLAAAAYVTYACYNQYGTIFGMP
jgi:flagellin-like protein